MFFVLIFREVGGRKLKLGTRLVEELPEFSGELSLEGLYFWKTAFSAMTHPTITSSSLAQGAEASEARKEQAKLDQASAADKKIVLLPCRIPPSRERVQLWLEARKQYESLQRGRRETGLLRKGAGPDAAGHSETSVQPTVAISPALRTEARERLSLSRTQRRKKLRISLDMSPMKDTGYDCKSTDTSPDSDKGSVGAEQEGKEGDSDRDAKATSPESPELPPWQQPSQLGPPGPEQRDHTSPGARSPGLSDSVDRAEHNLSPSPFHGSKTEEAETSPLLAHSTPFLRRRRKSKEDLGPVCSTPKPEGRERSDLFSLLSQPHLCPSLMALLLLQRILSLRDWSRGGEAKLTR